MSRTGRFVKPQDLKSFCGILHHLHKLAAASMMLLICSSLQRPKRKRDQTCISNGHVSQNKTHCVILWLWPLEPGHCILCDAGGPRAQGLFLLSLAFFSGLAFGGNSLWASSLNSCRSFSAFSGDSSTYCNCSSSSLSCSGRLQLTGRQKDKWRKDLESIFEPTPCRWWYISLLWCQWLQLSGLLHKLQHSWAINSFLFSPEVYSGHWPKAISVISDMEAKPWSLSSAVSGVCSLSAVWCWNNRLLHSSADGNTTTAFRLKPENNWSLWRRAEKRMLHCKAEGTQEQKKVQQFLKL